jgi:hypothetical protein
MSSPDARTKSDFGRENEARAHGFWVLSAGWSWLKIFFGEAGNQDYPCLPMKILVVPTFVNIVLAITWLIDAALAIGLVFLFYIYDIRDPRSVPSLGAVPQTSYQKVKDQRQKLAVYKYERREFHTIFLPIMVVIALITFAVQIWLPRMQPSLARMVLGSVVVLLFALLLFVIKVNTLLLYGYLEGLFALGSCVWSLGNKVHDTLTPEATITLLGSIYLMIRAMDNIKKGLEQRENQKKEKRNKGPEPADAHGAT